MNRREKLVNIQKKFIKTMKELDDALDQYEKELMVVMQQLLEEVGWKKKLSRDFLFMRGGVHCADWKVAEQNYSPFVNTQTEEEEMAFFKAVTKVSAKFYRKTKVKIVMMGPKGIVYLPKKRTRRG